MAAALAEYAAHGRAGFSLNGVARRAGVGKSSIYLRWPDKETLLVDAVVARSHAPDTDTGSLRGDLEELVTFLLGHFLSEVGWVAVRIAVDGVADGPGDEAPLGPLSVGAQHAETVGSILRRAMARGELADDQLEAARTMVRMMYGDLLLCAMVDRQRLAAYTPDQRRAEARALVELLLRLLG